MQGGARHASPPLSSLGGAAHSAEAAVTGSSVAVDVEEELRTRLEEWQAAGVMTSKDEVDEVIQQLAAAAKLEPQKVRMVWLSVARQARFVGGSLDQYITFAKRHHSIDTEAVDLGQYSAEHSNSCMFLTCAASIAHRRLQGFADAELPGILGEAIDEAGFFDQRSSIEELVREHRRDRISTLGRMADALRHAACEVLLCDEDFYLPFFHPVRSVDPGGTEPTAEHFRKWVENMRADEEGDELVILTLARICGMAVQPVHKTGYRVPIMDPLDMAETGYVNYWGNDDRHWVWLRPKDE